MLSFFGQLAVGVMFAFVPVCYEPTSAQHGALAQDAIEAQDRLEAYVLDRTFPMLTVLPGLDSMPRLELDGLTSPSASRDVQAIRHGQSNGMVPPVGNKSILLTQLPLSIQAPPNGESPTKLNLSAEGPTGGMLETSRIVTSDHASCKLGKGTSDVPNLREFGCPQGADWTAVVNAAEDSDMKVISVPPGFHPVTLSHFEAVNKVYTGPGQIVTGADASGNGGTAEAKFRAFITAPIAQPLSKSGQSIFQAVHNFEESKVAVSAYTLSTSAATPPVSTVYTHMPQLAQTIRVYENGAGFQTNLNNQANGRSGGAMDYRYLNHGGQGDFGLEYNHIEIYGDTAGATHFLAKPAASFTGGDIAASAKSANGKYLQISEHNVYDNGTAAAVIGHVINYHRTNQDNALGQVWIHDHPQAPTDANHPIDAFYNPRGSSKRGLDFSGSDFSAGSQAAIVLAPQQRIFFGGYAAPDRSGLVTISTSLGFSQIYQDSLGHVHIDPGMGKTVIIDNMPNSSSGLPSGAIWRDPANDNVLKIVP